MSPYSVPGGDEGIYRPHRIKMRQSILSTSLGLVPARLTWKSSTGRQPVKMPNFKLSFFSKAEQQLFSGLQVLPKHKGVTSSGISRPRSELWVKVTDERLVVRLVLPASYSHKQHTWTLKYFLTIRIPYNTLSFLWTCWIFYGNVSIMQLYSP